MNTRNLGIILDQSTDFSVVIGIFNDLGPTDLTGYSFLGEMRATTDPDSPVVVEFGFDILDQTTNKGQVQWTISSTQDDETDIPTSVATPLVNKRQTTPFVFDVKMQDNLGKVSRIIQGIIYVSPEATQESFP